MAKHNGLIPSDEADKLYSYPTLPADSSKVLRGNGTWGDAYSHPTRTAVTGKPTANQTPAFGGTATVSQYAFDTNGHISSATDRTIKIPNSTASSSAAGLMSAADKSKLDGIDAGANAYSHPAYSAITGTPAANQTPAFGGTFTVNQVDRDATGHVGAITSRTVKIPNVTASNTSAGLMSKDDKSKLDGIDTGAQVNTITGVKGDSESAFRTGNVNITAANVGAAAAEHSHADASTVEGGFMSAADKQTLLELVAELENIPRPTVRVFSVTGSTVTATSDAITLTAVVWEIKLPRYGAWTIMSTTPDEETYTEVVDVDDVKKYFVGLGIEVKRYGYRIKEAEPDPYERVEYILDAVGMTPAHMDFENEVFEYGSWRDVWFVSDNKPLMLKYDGTVDYYLDPNDYTLREDGETASDVSNADYEGNAMAQFPLCWIYRYEDDTYKYEIVSNVKYDENYKAYAHTRADGTIADYFYWGIYYSIKIEDKLRSLSSTQQKISVRNDQRVEQAQTTGAKWNCISWSQMSFIRTLLTLVGKSTDTRNTFGYDRARGTTSYLDIDNDNKGQFYGQLEYTPAKAFHVSELWGGTVVMPVGVFHQDSRFYVKMTPEDGGYLSSSRDGYKDVGVQWINAKKGYLYYSKGHCGSYGFLPTRVIDGSSSTYYCDPCQEATASTNNALLVVGSGGTWSTAQKLSGIYFFIIYSRTASQLMRLACEQPLPQEEETNDG